MKYPTSLPALPAPSALPETQTHDEARRDSLGLNASQRKALDESHLNQLYALFAIGWVCGAFVAVATIIFFYNIAPK
jgi:uncharacterized membrane protein